MAQSLTVTYRDVKIMFSVPNSLSRYRIETFSSKEPETLEWIDNIPIKSVFWDIGANIGLYSCYAAMARQCSVYSFEPSVFNIELLARNIYLNKLDSKITIVPIPLTEMLTESHLNMTSTEWGGALSTFGKNYGHDGMPMNDIFRFATIGMSMSDMRNILNIPQPDYIKIDVDGIEHLIIKGGEDVLIKVKGILIEVNDKFIEQASSVSEDLQKFGFKLVEKRHADYFDTYAGAGSWTYNQIWVR